MFDHPELPSKWPLINQGSRDLQAFLFIKYFPWLYLDCLRQQFALMVPVSFLWRLRLAHSYTLDSWNKGSSSSLLLSLYRKFLPEYEALSEKNNINPCYLEQQQYKIRALKLTLKYLATSKYSLWTQTHCILIIAVTEHNYLN